MFILIIGIAAGACAEWVACTTAVGLEDDIQDKLYGTYESLLQNYKDLFDMNLQMAINMEVNGVPSLYDTAARTGKTIISDFTDEELYFNRTLGEYTLDRNESEYADRKRKCNSLKCGEDCNNDSDCYWKIPFDILNSESFSHCSCEPNIFIDNDSFLGKESLQKKLAENFYDVYAEDLQSICRPSDSDEGPFNMGRDEEKETKFCQDLENTTRISEAIFSSQTNTNVNEIYEKCLDKEGDHRNNILKKCLSRPIDICKDENDENPDCIELIPSYLEIIKDIFGYYVLRNTSYENPERCECNLLKINEEGPPFYSFDERKYLYRNDCEEETSGIPYGICGNNMPVVQSYLDMNSSLIIDESTAREYFTGSLNKNLCQRTNYVDKYNDIEYYHSRLYCDPFHDNNTFNLDDEIEQMINNNYYETDLEYHISQGIDPQSFPDNNLREWDSVTQQYNIDIIDYNKDHCNSDIHKCMGFETIKKSDNTFSDLYEKILDSHYYLLPLDVSHETRDLGYMRYYSALNNYYMGDLTFNIPYGELYSYMIETMYNAVSNATDGNFTVLEQQYNVVQAVKRGENISSHVEEGQAGDEMGSIDREELEESLLREYKIDYLNKIRDYGILAILLICSAIFLYFYSIVILFVHIPWIIIYILYVKIKEYF